MIRQFLVIIIIIIAAGCQPKVLKEKKTPSIPLIQSPKFSVITVESENVRMSPNGQKIGQLLKGDTLQVIKRQGNWLLFHNDFFDSAYIWAPSAGFDYINLYNPLSYYDTIAQDFFPTAYFRKLFGNLGIEIPTPLKQSQIFFGELGLGSHEDIVIEVTTEQTETTAHGITLYTQEPTNNIFQIKIDFFSPIKGIEKTLERCDLEFILPDIQNGGHVIWKKNTLVPGLEIDLERREWESDWYSVLWLRLKSED
jgi:hypothetical protein